LTEGPFEHFNQPPGIIERTVLYDWSKLDIPLSNMDEVIFLFAKAVVPL